MIALQHVSFATIALQQRASFAMIKLRQNAQQLLYDEIAITHITLALIIHATTRAAFAI